MCRLAADQIPPFLRAVRKIYRTQNQYHNFQHALDVFQAVYWFLCRAGVVPPVKILAQPKQSNGVYTNGSLRGEEREEQGGRLINGLGQPPRTGGGKWRRAKVQGRIGVLRNVDVFALLLAAVGHDVGHPGLSNAFMVSGVIVTMGRITDRCYPHRQTQTLHSPRSSTTNPRSSSSTAPSSCVSCTSTAWATYCPLGLYHPMLGPVLV